MVRPNEQVRTKNGKAKYYPEDWVSGQDPGEEINDPELRANGILFQFDPNRVNPNAKSRDKQDIQSQALTMMVLQARATVQNAFPKETEMQSTDPAESYRIRSIMFANTMDYYALLWNCYTAEALRTGVIKDLKHEGTGFEGKPEHDYKGETRTPEEATAGNENLQALFNEFQTALSRGRVSAFSGGVTFGMNFGRGRTTRPYQRLFAAENALINGIHTMGATEYGTGFNPKTGKTYYDPDKVGLNSDERASATGRSDNLWKMAKKTAEGLRKRGVGKGMALRYLSNSEYLNKTDGMPSLDGTIQSLAIYISGETHGRIAPDLDMPESTGAMDAMDNVDYLKSLKNTLRQQVRPEILDRHIDNDPSLPSILPSPGEKFKDFVDTTLKGTGERPSTAKERINENNPFKDLEDRGIKYEDDYRKYEKRYKDLVKEYSNLMDQAARGQASERTDPQSRPEFVRDDSAKFGYRQINDKVDRTSGAAASKMADIENWISELDEKTDGRFNLRDFKDDALDLRTVYNSYSPTNLKGLDEYSEGEDILGGLNSDSEEESEFYTHMHPALERDDDGNITSNSSMYSEYTGGRGGHYNWDTSEWYNPKSYWKDQSGLSGYMRENINEAGKQREGQESVTQLRSPPGSLNFQDADDVIDLKSAYDMVTADGGSMDTYLADKGKHLVVTRGGRVQEVYQYDPTSNDYIKIRSFKEDAGKSDIAPKFEGYDKFDPETLTEGYEMARKNPVHYRLLRGEHKDKPVGKLAGLDPNSYTGYGGPEGLISNKDTTNYLNNFKGYVDTLNKAKQYKTMRDKMWGENIEDAYSDDPEKKLAWFTQTKDALDKGEDVPAMARSLYYSGYNVPEDFDLGVDDSDKKFQDYYKDTYSQGKDPQSFTSEDNKVPSDQVKLTVNSKKDSEKSRKLEEKWKKQDKINKKIARQKERAKKKEAKIPPKEPKEKSDDSVAESSVRKSLMTFSEMIGKSTKANTSSTHSADTMSFTKSTDQTFVGVALSGTDKDYPDMKPKKGKMSGDQGSKRTMKEIPSFKKMMMDKCGSSTAKSDITAETGGAGVNDGASVAASSDMSFVGAEDKMGHGDMPPMGGAPHMDAPPMDMPPADMGGAPPMDTPPMDAPPMGGKPPMDVPPEAGMPEETPQTPEDLIAHWQEEGLDQDPELIQAALDMLTGGGEEIEEESVEEEPAPEPKSEPPKKEEKSEDKGEDKKDEKEDDGGPVKKSSIPTFSEMLKR